MKRAPKKIVVIAEYSASSGFGNLVRSVELASEFAKFETTELLICTEFEATCKPILPEAPNYEVKFFNNLANLIQSVSDLDHAILDCPSSISERAASAIKDKFPLSTVTALDCPYECKDFDLRISLFDGVLNTLETTTKDHKVGIDFAIISKNVKIVQERVRVPEVLVKFSGKKSNLLAVTEEIIRDVFQEADFNVCIINNGSDGVNNTDFKEQADFLNRLSTCSLYVGSGVTTLFEASLLETPAIFIGSNEAERQFGMAISKAHSVTTLDSTRIEFIEELRSLLKGVLQSNQFERFIPKIEVDFFGAQRIVDLVLQS